MWEKGQTVDTKVRRSIDNWQHECRTRGRWPVTRGRLLRHEQQRIGAARTESIALKYRMRNVPAIWLRLAPVRSRIPLNRSQRPQYSVIECG
jgi:hypothetical protein